MRPTGCGGHAKGHQAKPCRKGVYYTDVAGQGWCYVHDPRPETAAKRHEHELRAGDNARKTFARRKMYAKLQTGIGVWLPTSENVNNLPKPLRDYIHELESFCDPQGLVRENVLLRDQNIQLALLVDELKQRGV